MTSCVHCEFFFVVFYLVQGSTIPSVSMSLVSELRMAFLMTIELLHYLPDPNIPSTPTAPLRKQTACSTEERQKSEMTTPPAME
jgi:hypothetical protein